MGENRHITSSNTHVTVVVSLGVEDVSGGIVGDPHQGVVGSRLKFVSKRSRLRPSIEEPASDNVAVVACDGSWTVLDGRGPRLNVGPVGGIDLRTADEHFAGWQTDQA